MWSYAQTAWKLDLQQQNLGANVPMLKEPRRRQRAGGGRDTEAGQTQTGVQTAPVQLLG